MAVLARDIGLSERAFERRFAAHVGLAPVKSASVKEAFRPGPQPTTLYVEVAELTDVESRLRDEHLVMPRRTTFYSSTELGYSDAAGNIVVFAEHAKS